MRDRRSGSAILEFALGSSFLIALFAGTIQFGFTYFAYERLVSAVRAGARYGSMAVYDTGAETVNSSPSSAFLTAVRNVTAFGSASGTDGGAPSIVSGLKPEHVNVNVRFESGVPSLVTVSIKGYAVNSVFGTWNAQNKPAAAFAYVGRYAPPE